MHVIEILIDEADWFNNKHKSGLFSNLFEDESKIHLDLSIFTKICDDFQSLWKCCWSNDNIVMMHSMSVGTIDDVSI